MNTKQASDIINRFVSGNMDSPWDWDDFLSERDGGPIINLVRGFCGELAEIFPPRAESGMYCSDAGMAVLLELAAVLLEGEAHLKTWLKQAEITYTLPRLTDSLE